ncbi:MAG: molybdopterin-dependent oxidoreductase [Acidobacteria bacterium]|nr:molybdopterin-dependent oxidoreductase [Acidobacteriota bacterium]
MREIIGTITDKRVQKAQLGRRGFLRFSATLAGACSVGPLLIPTPAKALTTGANPPDPLENDPNVRVRYTVCLMCNSGCGLRVKVHNGVIAKIDGNPYHPNNMEAYERLPYATDPKDALTTIGRVCVKAQAYAENVYSPYRLRTPLKRVGKRGEGKWQAIGWDQALDEIGAKLSQYRSFDPIDPALPELGPKVNQILFAPGRIQDGRKHFTDRWFGNCLGTINFRQDHTSICEESHHIAGFLATEYRKNHFKPDIARAEYIIWFGANPLEANFPAQTLGRKLMDFTKRGGKMAVVDPRFSKTASKADVWIPAKPGTDAAVAMGIARWMIDNGKGDWGFLMSPSKAAAAKRGETTWTDSTFLVNQTTRKFVRPAEAGLAGVAADYVVSAGGKLALASAVDSADLNVTTTAGKDPAKSVFQLVVERLRERTVAQYAAIAGVDESLLVKVAQEFAAHGKRSVANMYRGTCANTHGSYAVLAVYVLNMLAGNFDHIGGNAGGGGALDFVKGSGKSGQVNASVVPGGLTPKGIPLTRWGKKYDVDAPNLFKRDGYPARRPWFPFATLGNYQEVVPSIFDGYPYPLKALFTYWNAWPYSTPGQRETFEKTVADESKLPLFVAIDIEMGQVSSWADYILPDTTVLERWSTPTVAPAILTKTNGWRQPVVGTFDDKSWDAPFDPAAANNYRGVVPGARMLEEILLDLGKRMGLPGHGGGAFADGTALNTPWDFYRKLFTNVAMEAGITVEDGIARGGYFDPVAKEYGTDGMLVSKYANLIRFYQENLAATTDSMTGKPFDAMFNWYPTRDVLDRVVDDSKDYPLQLVTYKPMIHAMARTAMNPSLMALRPTNFIEMSSSDGKVYGLETGDMIRVISPSGSIREKAVVQLSEGIRPGVIAVAHSYGNWKIGSEPYSVDGKKTPYDQTRASGIAVNPIMRLDPYLKNVTLQDKIGCNPSFQETRVRIEKI